MNRVLRAILIVLAAIVGFILMLLFVVGPIATRPRAEFSEPAAQWRDRGGYFRWKSTLPENARFGDLEIFHIEEGDPKNPAILFIHGYPTSSFDFRELFELLRDDYYVLAIDTPGYGLSDKPRNGFLYSIEDDARLVDYYVREVAGIESFSLYTHDKGNSVGLAFLGLAAAQDDYEIIHHFITNGNIYLPLADLTREQLLLLDDGTGPFFTRYMNGTLFARGMNRRMHSIPEGDEKVEGVATMIDYQDGGEVQHATIQYLAQRGEFELEWLANLEHSTAPVTLIWGVDDPVAPTAVADFVWSEYLRHRETLAEYWRLPEANHYLQNDRPDVIAHLMRKALGENLDPVDPSLSVQPEAVRINSP